MLKPIVLPRVRVSVYLAERNGDSIINLNFIQSISLYFGFVFISENYLLVKIEA